PAAWLWLSGHSPEWAAPTLAAAARLGAALRPETWPGWLAPTLAVVVGAALGLVVSRPVNWLLAGFFLLFNAAFGVATTVYTHGTGLLLRGSAIVLLLYVGLLGTTYWLFDRTPKGFIPGQDMGYLLVSVQLPDSASKERTDKVLRDLEDIGLNT